MGVDFKICSDCKETFPDNMRHTRCGGCDNLFCGHCAQGYVLYNEDGYSNATGEQLDERQDPLCPEAPALPTTCPFCTYEKIEESDLVTFLLGLVKMSRQEAEDAFRLRQKVFRECRKDIQACPPIKSDFEPPKHW